MGFRSRVGDTLVRVGKTFGTSVPESFRQGEQASQMTPASPFSPGQPIGPYDGYDRFPRQRDFVTGYNIATRPRVHERVSFETLKGLIGAYDVASICLWHRIDSIRSLDWRLVSADHWDGDVTDAIPVGLAALEKPDRENYFDTWLARWAYDILAYDAGALYRLRNRAGRAVGLMPVDGTTIAPLLDYWGRSPKAAGPGEPEPEAFVQYANGLPWNWLTRSDLIYAPFRPHNDSIYGQPPIESIILNANTDIRFQVYFLQRFTDGNLPAAFASAPESWSPDQIEQFQQLWDAAMYGQQDRMHQVRWMPPGSKFVWSNEKDFSDVFSLFLMRKTAAAFHVVPADIGFTENVNKSSGDSQADVQHRVGDLPLIRFLARIITGFLQNDLGLPLKFTFDLGEEQEDRLALAQADDIYIKNGTVSASHVAEMRFGRADPRPVPRYIYTARSGPIPLNSLEAVAGQIDPQTAMPAEGTPLPHEVFEGAPGVEPNPPLYGQPLAEEIYGPKAIPPHTEGQGLQQVKKDGEAAPAAGVTSETGIYGDPLIRDDEDDEPEAEVTKARAAELAAFRRYRKNRRQRGTWQDFAFAAVDTVTAHNLNDAGRLAVRKAAGEVAVAGLAVRAADTGRVLMLQRALDPDDPAGGKIEFPGGHLDNGESPLQGAWREFAEETGAVPPPGVQTGMWTAGDGIYQGIVWTADSEASVPVRGGSVVPNPDDPDGDQSEAIMWVDPQDLAGNPLVRDELAASLPDVMAALGVPPACCGGECCQDGGCCGGTGGCICGPKALDGSAVAKASRGPTLHLPSLTGVWGEIYDRRTRLLTEQTRAVAAAWDACVAERSTADLVADFRSRAGLVAKAASPDRKRWYEAGTAAALTWLKRLYKTKGWRGLTAALEDAIRSGMAEGRADALALAADRQGVTGFQVEQAFRAAYDDLAGDKKAARQAQDAAERMAEGAAKDIGRALADAAEDDSSDEDTAEAAGEAASGGNSQSVEVGTDWWFWTGLGLGALALYQAAGTAAGSGNAADIAGLFWISAGDSRVCATCSDNEDNSPYTLSGAPSLPAHGRCRCSWDYVASVPSSFFADFLS